VSHSQPGSLYGAVITYFREGAQANTQTTIMMTVTAICPDTNFHNRGLRPKDDAATVAETTRPAHAKKIVRQVVG